MSRHLSGGIARLAAAVLLATVAAAAGAVPTLQLYVEGASYDTTHESWVFDVTNQPIRLWVIGNVDTPQGAIYDVKLSVVYPDPVPGDGGADVGITLTPSTTAGYGGFFDPGTPVVPTFVQVDESGAQPLLSDGSSLPAHGTYGPGFEWQEFALGDFTAIDSPVADFISTFPAAPSVAGGQINVYEVTVTGNLSDVHFDAYDHVVAGNHAKARFAPFSHDAGTGTNEPFPAPEPASVLLAGLGLLALVAGARRGHGGEAPGARLHRGARRGPMTWTHRGRVLADFALDWRGIHGIAHWLRVRENGLALAERTR